MTDGERVCKEKDEKPVEPERGPLIKRDWIPTLCKEVPKEYKGVQNTCRKHCLTRNKI